MNGPMVFECPPGAPPVTAYAVDEHGITFSLNPGQMRLDVCEEDMFRVQYTTEHRSNWRWVRDGPPRERAPPPPARRCHYRRIDNEA